MEVLSKLFLVLLCLCATFLNVPAQTLQRDTAGEPDKGSISGRVVSQGQGVAGAVVIAQPAIASERRTATTDNNGKFVFDSLDRGLYRFYAFASGFLTAPRDADLAPEYYRIGETVSLDLIKGGVITGTVLSAAGEPVVQVGVVATLIRFADRPASRSPGYPMGRLTDDRGVYRIYGLPPGTYLVSAGGRTSYGGVNAYDEDAPTYAPSSTRDTAGQIVVTSGNESIADIKYRGETGHAISGTIIGTADADIDSSLDVLLTQAGYEPATESGGLYILRGRNSFSFYGVGDGEYDLSARLYSPKGSSVSESKRVTVRGADITGIELNLKPMASVSGQVVLSKSNLPECKDKRAPVFSETLISLIRDDDDDDAWTPLHSFFVTQTVPNAFGEFHINNLVPGQHSFTTRFFAKYWYLKSIVRKSGAVAEKPQTDLARGRLELRFGESLSGVNINLAEGAASLHGTVKPKAEDRLPQPLVVYLVPAEKEAADDVLRFFAGEVKTDGSIAFNNLPPGRYWVITQIAGNDAAQVEAKLRLPNMAARRAGLRRNAEAAKLLVELKPCQNVTNYTLSGVVPPTQQ